jgi:hypothetical protein
MHNYDAVQRNTVKRLREFDAAAVEAEIQRRLVKLR